MHERNRRLDLAIGRDELSIGRVGVHRIRSLCRIELLLATARNRCTAHQPCAPARTGLGIPASCAATLARAIDARFRQHERRLDRGASGRSLANRVEDDLLVPGPRLA